MRIAGILAVICVVLSFFLWISSWTTWTFFYAFTTTIPGLSTVLSAVGFTANILELLAVLLVAIGVILASRKPKES